ncbi:hypothetical protein GCM10010174_88850 [Kutzneria viridogrisea]|uniref:DNA-binding protein YbaB n=1 Tax=Kutzneria viridogrisea TaxID=47990 RepID=A0ABR6BIT1_9PSEU|nr:DNA-binding protein YbaB [Kutzneria viridogrisea]
MTGYDQMYALAAEIDAAIRTAREAAVAAARRPHTVPIEPGLGTVTANGAGELLAVALDPRALATSNSRALGAQVMAAIHHAENAARAAAAQETAAATTIVT